MKKKNFFLEYYILLNRCNYSSSVKHKNFKVPDLRFFNVKTLQPLQSEFKDEILGLILLSMLLSTYLYFDSHTNLCPPPYNKIYTK